MTEAGLEQWAAWIGRLAKAALLEEVYTKPKPGLVDPLSRGAHQDMGLAEFVRSAEALEPYFREMARMGMEGAKDGEGLFPQIRQVGIRAEKAMYEATGGINTHKGAVFTLGILCASSGACLARYGKVSLSELTGFAQGMTRRILLGELCTMLKREDDLLATNGQRNLMRYGALGVRGEAAYGYPSVTELALPVLAQGLREKRDWNSIKLQVLFTLMSQVEDGNVLSRTGKRGLEEVQRIAGAFLKAGGAYQERVVDQLKKMDRYFTRKNYSNGGCADLLAAAIFCAAVTAARVIPTGGMADGFPAEGMTSSLGSPCRGSS